MNLHFFQVLRAGHVDLRVEAGTRSGAVEHLLASLHGDERIINAEQFSQAVRARGTPAICSHRLGVCIAHGRTDAVSGLVMAAARLAHPLPIEPAEGEGHLRLVFVAGIPSALNTEYLRLVGAIARICADPEEVNRLLGVKEPGRFVEILEGALNPL